MVKLLASRLVPSFLQHNLRLVVLGRCLLVVVMNFQDKFASLRQLNNPNSRDKFQIIMLYRHVFVKFSSEFCSILHALVTFAGFRRFYLNFASPCYISEALIL